MSTKKPNFFIIGAPKCGTTALARYLGEHPDIFISPTKEPDFFAADMRRSVPDERDYFKLFEGAENYKAAGEASTIYLYSKEAVKNILKFNPDAKFIVMTRNPADMFQALHAQNLINLKESIKDAEDAWRAQETRGEDEPFLQYGRVCKLGEQVERLYSIVPDTNNIKIIKFSKFKTDTKGIYEEVLNFLGVESDGRKEFPIYGGRGALKSRALKRFVKLISEPGIIKKLSSSLKRKLGMPYWPFAAKLGRWNIKQVPKVSLRPEFRRELEEYFREDQKLLERLINEQQQHSQN